MPTMPICHLLDSFCGYSETHAGGSCQRFRTSSNGIWTEFPEIKFKFHPLAPFCLLNKLRKKTLKTSNMPNIQLELPIHRTWRSIQFKRCRICFAYRKPLRHQFGTLSAEKSLDSSESNTGCCTFLNLVPISGNLQGPIKNTNLSEIGAIFPEAFWFEKKKQKLFTHNPPNPSPHEGTCLRHSLGNWSRPQAGQAHGFSSPWSSFLTSTVTSAFFRKNKKLKILKTLRTRIAYHSLIGKHGQNHQ